MTWEGLKATLIKFYTPMRFIGGLLLLALGAVWLKSSIDLNRAQKNFYEQGNSAAGNLVKGSEEFYLAMHELRTQHLPKIVDNADAGITDIRAIIQQSNTDIHRTLAQLDSGLGEVTGLVSDLRRDSPAGSIKRLVDNAEPHLTQSLANVETATGSLAESARVLDEAIKDPKIRRFVDDAMKHGDSILGNFDTVSGDLTLTTKEINSVTTHLDSVAANFEAMTTDSKNKLHEVLYPAPVRGFWPKVGRILKFVYQPAYDGIRIYYTLRALPVRVTEPIPLLK